MSQYITKIKTASGDLQIDYNALANLPTTDIELNTTGVAADAKAVGDAISGINTLIGNKSVSDQINAAMTEIASDINDATTTATNNAKTYTDNRISELINGAPTTLDTLSEIATAMETNDNVVAALESSIGTKANAGDLTSHTSNKSNPHGITLSQLGVTATATELNYVDGVTSSIQTQLNNKETSGAAATALTNAKSYTDTQISTMVGSTNVATQISTAISSKQNTITGAATTITGSNLTASRALVSNGSGKVGVSSATSTELSYLVGATSNIQAQLDSKAASSHGTHVTFSTTAPVVAGTASVGTANTVSRSDHVHPVQTTVSGNAGSATKLATARNIRTNLASTSTASFNGSADITPGVTGTLAVGNGGTGYTSITDTTYTTARYRASSLHASEATPSANGVIAWVYE